MRFFIAFFFCLTTSLAAHADSVDVYKVSLRGKPLGTFNANQIINVVLLADSVASTDTLVVDVFRDTRPVGGKAEYSMIIFGNAGPMLVDSTQHTESFKVPLKPLVEYKRKTRCSQFHGYYTQYLTAQRSRVISFRITLQ